MNVRRLVLGHLTDLHLRLHQPHGCINPAVRSRAMAGLLPLALARLKERGAEAIVVTGDLVDVPEWITHPDDYYHYPIERWQPRVEDDYRAVRSALDACGLPYLVLPGNHDDERVFWHVFPPQPDEVLWGGYRVLRFCDREERTHVPRRFDRALKRWQAALADTDATPQIHLQHYTIAPALDEGYPFNYYEADYLRQGLASTDRVILSLSGHYHAGTDLLRLGQCAVTTAPAIGKFPHPVRLYTLQERDVQAETIPLASEPMGAGRPVVFLDRDGVINDRPRYYSGPEEMRLLPGVAHAVLALREAGYAVVVITNQSCIGSGHVSFETVQAVHDRMCQLLVEEAGELEAQPDAIYACPDAGPRAVHPDFAGVSRAKPSPAMLEEACATLGLRRDGAWFVGDSLVDLQAASAFGARPLLVRTGHGVATLDLAETKLLSPMVADDLAAAVAIILSS